MTVNPVAKTPQAAAADEVEQSSMSLIEHLTEHVRGLTCSKREA